MDAETWARRLGEYAVEKIGDHHGQVRRCVGLLSEEQVWFRPNERSHSVGNLVLHLCGNVTQWVLGGLGGRPYARDRGAEFAVRGAVSREELRRRLGETLAAAETVLRGLTPEAVAGEHEIQQYRVTGLAAVLHVVEHFAFHTGQIVTTTKWLLDVDLSLYDERGRRRDGRQAGIP